MRYHFDYIPKNESHKTYKKKVKCRRCLELFTQEHTLQRYCPKCKTKNYKKESYSKQHIQKRGAVKLSVRSATPRWSRKKIPGGAGCAETQYKQKKTPMNLMVQKK